LSEPAGFGPYSFSLTENEARLAASRLALRLGLGARFERDYVAPLVVFILLLLFVAILAFSGLIGRRFAEATLLVGAMVFLATRFFGHWRLRRAQRRAEETVRKIVDGGEIQIRVQDDGLVLHSGSAGKASGGLFRWTGEAEDAGGVIYLWRSDDEGAPIIIPTRIFGSAEEARRFLAFVQVRIAKP
jgi:hypothetical protein